MYPFCLTLDERQSIWQKRTGRQAKHQPTGNVPQPERRNEIFPTTVEVGDCPSKEEGGDGEEEEEPTCGAGQRELDMQQHAPLQRLNHC